MKLRKFTALLLSFAILPICFCSCGDGGANDPDTLLGTAAKNENAKEVNLSMWCSEADTEMTLEMIESFKEAYKDEYKLSVVISKEDESSCRETVLADLDGAPDIFSYPDDQFYDLHKAGALREITENADEIIAANGGSEAGAIIASTSDGKLYAYPMTATNGYFMYYDKSYFTEEDVKSLESMLSVCEKNGKYLTIDYTSGWYLYSFFKAAGLSVDMDKEKNVNVCDWNSADGKYTGKDVFKSLLAVSSSKGFRNDTDNAFINGIKDGSVIAGISGTWYAKEVSEALGENYAACKLPTVNIAGDDLQMHSFAGFKLMSVKSNTKYPECALALAKWLTNEENQKKRFALRGEGPSNVNAAADDSVKNDIAISALLAQSPYAHIQNVATPFWSASSYIGVMAAAGVVDENDIQKNLDKAVADITAPVTEE